MSDHYSEHDATYCLTKSNAAIFLLPVVGVRAVDAAYRPTRRLSFTIRHVIFSGSFFDSGVKKFATALPEPSLVALLYKSWREAYLWL
jgi:hypothetical protein